MKRVFIDEDYVPVDKDWWTSAKLAIKGCPKEMRGVMKGDQGFVVTDAVLKKFEAWASGLPGWIDLADDDGIPVFWVEDRSHEWPEIVKQAKAAGHHVRGLTDEDGKVYPDGVPPDDTWFDDVIQLPGGGDLENELGELRYEGKLVPKTCKTLSQIKKWASEQRRL